jgi:hypothetical protein
MGSWWFMWIVFMLVFVAPPIGYGWGYRGWGPPYPRYIQRRRRQQAADIGSGVSNHDAWGWGGDLVWGILIIGMLWAACNGFLAPK